MPIVRLRTYARFCYDGFASGVLIIPILHIRNPFKAFCQPCPHLLFPGILIAARLSASGHIEDTVICEVVQDGIQVMAVERLQESLLQFNGHMLRHWVLHVQYLVEKD